MTSVEPRSGESQPAGRDIGLVGAGPTGRWSARRVAAGAGRRWVVQDVANGTDPAPDTDLGIDRAEVGVHCAGADPQLLGDLLVAQRGGDQGEDLRFAAGKGRGGPGRDQI